MVGFFQSVKDLAATRKFWVGMLGAVLNALAVFFADQPQLAPLFSLLAAWGVWRVPNKV